MAYALSVHVAARRQWKGEGGVWCLCNAPPPAAHAPRQPHRTTLKVYAPRFTIFTFQFALDGQELKSGVARERLLRFWFFGKFTKFLKTFAASCVVSASCEAEGIQLSPTYIISKPLAVYQVLV